MLERKEATVKVRIVKAVVEFELDLEEFDPETDQTFGVDEVNEVDPRDDEAVRSALLGQIVKIESGPFSDYAWGEIISVETFSDGESERIYQLLEEGEGEA